MTLGFIRLAAATALVATSLAYAGDPVQLNKEEVQKALAGKSLTYAARGSAAGGQVVIFFAAEGRMTLKLSNGARMSSGTWSVDDDGRYCIKVISGNASDGCRHLLKTDTGYAMKTGGGEIVPVDKME
jgi:hypothetical protein